MPNATDYQRARTDAVLFDVSDRGKVEVGGPEAPSFLNNLATNDIVNLPLGGGCETFFTNAKAKVVVFAPVYHVRLSGGRDALWLDVGAGQAERLLQHLDHYLISEQVEQADRTAEFGQFHLAGPRARRVLEAALGEAVPELGPLEHMERTLGTSATCHIRRHEPLGLPGYDLVFLRSRADEVRGYLLSAGAGAAGPETCEILRIEAGTPVYGIDIDENRFAVEVGRTAAISYTKGCYLGQEPIVMARDRAGHVNRAFRGLKFSQPAAGGTKLLAADGKDVGIVTSSTQSPRLGVIGLGYVRRGSEEPGTVLTLGSPAEGSATVTGFPIS